MEEWSILSDPVKYVMHGESEAFQKFRIDSLNYRQNRDLYRKLNNEVVLKSKLNFGKSQKVKSRLSRHIQRSIHGGYKHR